MANKQRLIDAEKAWKTAQTVFSDPVLLCAIQLALEKSPAEEVVRCKDCANYHEFISGNRCVHFNGGDGRAYQTSPNDFCSYGERRTDNAPD